MRLYIYVRLYLPPGKALIFPAISSSKRRTDSSEIDISNWMANSLMCIPLFRLIMEVTGLLSSGSSKRSSV